MKKYLTEFIGTFFLVLVIGLTAVSSQGSLLAPLAIGSMLMVMVFMGGHVSGAHYNPAVSLGAALVGKISSIDFVIYVIVQLIAALAASAVAFGITGKPFYPTPNYVQADNSVISVLVVEGLFTFALVLVVLNAAYAKETSGNSFYGLAIGFTVAAGAIAGGPISGGAFNPAVGFGPIVMDAIFQWDASRGLGHLWIYLVGPLAGGALAALIFWIQNPEDFVPGHRF